MVLTAVFEDVNTVLARVRIFISINLNLEKPFFAVLREFFQGVHYVLEFSPGCYAKCFLIIGSVEHAASFETLFRGG